MIAKDFSYNGKYLSLLGYMMALPDSEDNIGMSRELIKGTATSYKKEANHYGAKYTDSAVLNFFIVKDPCKNKDLRIKDYEIRELESWLTSTTTPCPLILEYSNNTIEYLGVFTDIVPFIFNGLNGFNLTFTCNSSFSYDSKKTIKEKGLSSIDVKINCNSDEVDYIYPVITLTDISNGYFSITNKSDGNKTMRILLSNTYSKYTIDCKYKRIVADNTVLSFSDVGWNIENIIDHNNIASGMYKMYWLRLLPEQNILALNTTNAKCTIEYKEIRKLGGFVDV